jgi:hypothetical protein
MTREEAISIMNVIIHMLEPQYDNDRVEEAVDMAIKALEQESVLDKIRTEIGNINLNEVAAKYEDRFYGFQREVIKILDKYKAESEDKE